jgi:hypothetical protein
VLGACVSQIPQLDFQLRYFCIGQHLQILGLKSYLIATLLTLEPPVLLRLSNGGWYNLHISNFSKDGR